MELEDTNDDEIRFSRSRNDNKLICRICGGGGGRGLNVEQKQDVNLIRQKTDIPQANIKYLPNAIIMKK